MKKLVLLLAVAMAAFSCAKTEMLETVQLQKKECFSVPLVMDYEADENGKSYLSDDGSTWKFVWEDEDRIGYFQCRRSYTYGPYTAEVDKRPYSVNVLYPEDQFRVGDNIYAYFYQQEMEDALEEMGYVNDDPSSLYVYIPSEQYSSFDPEVFEYAEDFSFSLASTKFDKTSVSKTATSSTNIVGYTPESRTVTFKINNYDSSLEYRCGGKASNLNIDFSGKASVTVSFDPFLASSQQGNYYWSNSEVTIFIAGHENDAAKFTAKARGQKTSKVNALSRKTTYSVDLTYTFGATANANVMIEHSDLGEEKLYPVRDCMPCVSKKYTVGYSAASDPSEIANGMTMYMLGSAIEFRVYTLDHNVGQGESFVGAMFETDVECAGIGTCNLIRENLAVEGFGENVITTINDEPQNVKYGKNNYTPLYMVLAPGTYSGTFYLVTDYNVYIYEFNSLNFARGNKTVFNCNLSSENCTIVSIEDFYADDPGEDPEEPEQPQQPEEPALPEVNQGTFELVNDGMRTFIADAEAQYTDSNRKTVSLVTTNNRSKYGFGGNGDLYQSGTNVTANDRPLPVTLTLDSALNGSNVSVTVYKNSEKTEVENTVSGTVSNAKFEIYNLIPNRTYYYTVNKDNEAVAIGYFQTTGTRRIIKVSDTIYADNANNCRDLGGLPTVDGGYIKYGKIFRGTNIDATTAAEQAILTGYLNIGLDVDLRGASSDKQRNIAKQIIPTIAYDAQKYSGASDLLVGSKIKNTFTAIVNALADGKASYIHCFAGADRTGYVCSLLLAVCGVSSKEITIDYELTSFSCVDLRDRSGKVKNEAFAKDYPTIEGYTGSTLKQKAENLLKSYGITDAQISALRAAMVEYPNN